jgi:hypothetical protein
VEVTGAGVVNFNILGGAGTNISPWRFEDRCGTNSRLQQERQRAPNSCIPNGYADWWKCYVLRFGIPRSAAQELIRSAPVCNLA